ncbi:TPA: DNA circularization protein [Photobacterium damselae]
MSFEERLTASFRGVEFLLEDVEGNGGRRAIPHAYPKRETGWAEDNGAELTNEKVAGRVVGKDYVEQLRSLLAALNQPGPGELIHPWWGVRQVQIGKVSHRFKLNEDLTAAFSFEVFEAGKPLFPTAAVDTANAVVDEATKAQEAVNDSFLGDWDLGALAGCGEMVDTFLDDLDEFTRGLPSLPDELREWTDRLARAKDSVGNLLAYPGELARETMGLLEDVKSVVTDPIRALNVYDQVQNRWNGMRAELSVTGGLSRNIVSSQGKAGSVAPIANPVLTQRVLNNSKAFQNLILTSSTISKASALGSSPLKVDVEPEIEIVNGLTGTESKAVLTGTQLQVIGNNIAEELAELSVDAVESGDSTVWRQLRVLRRTVLTDVRERAAMLPQINIYTPMVTEPVSLVAWRALGDTKKRQSIVRRNGLKNPAFILPGQNVEVVSG